MRIGIITYHRAINFGAALQVYALSRFLKELGHDVFIIDYQLQTSRLERLFSRENLMSILSSIFSDPRIMRRYLYSLLSLMITVINIRKSGNNEINMRHQKEALFAHHFRRFSDMHLKMTGQTYRSLADLRANPPDLDVYIAGSDQIWGLGNSTYFLPFYLDFGSKSVRRISYAASFGKSVIQKQWYGFLKHNIGRFDAVSVREKSGVKIIEDVCGMKATHTLDPTLLLKDYTEITRRIRLEGEFILVYRLHQDEHLSKAFDNIIRIASHESGLAVKSIATTIDLGTKGDDIITDVEGFLGYIALAKMVITNSFHGTVFLFYIGNRLFAFQGMAILRKDRIQE